MAFDTQAAAEAGHSIDDQINHLAKLHNYDSAAAEAAGFTKEAQLQYLAGLDEPAKAASPSMLDKVAEYFGISEEMPDAPIGAAIGAVAGPSMGPAIGEAVDFATNKLAGKVAPPGTAKPTGVPQGVINWYEQESGHPYAGGKTKETAYEKGQRAAGEPIQSRGSKIKIRKGSLGIDNQLEPQKPTLAQKTAANIINAEKVNSPSFTRRMLGTGVMGGELGSMKEELEKGNYGRAGLSGLGALGGAASQSKIKPIRAIGTGLSTLVPAIQMMLPESEDQSNINKKNGGRINGYARGKLVEEGGAKIMDMLKNKMAPLYVKAEGVPPPLPRAAPKSDEEIRAFAERMAPQIRGDFVRAPGATTSVAGKTRAQFEREKDLQHDIRDVFPLKQVSNYSDEAHQGKVKVGVAGDQTLTGKDVYSIAGNPLTEPSRQYGGALYPAAHPQGWASEKGAAQAMQNLADETSAQYGGADVLGQYLKMGPEASNYAMHNADAIIKSINPNQIKQLDTLNQMIRGRFPDFAGIENQAAILEQARKNPDLRKYLDYLVNTKKHAETHGLPSGADMRHALSEPDLRDLEIGATGKSIMQMKPGAKITPSSELTTTTYSHDIPGDYIGGTKYARPHELEFPDSSLALKNKIATVQDMAKQVIAENPNLDPQTAIAYAKKYGHQGFGGFRMSQPRQILDQQHIDETGKYEDYMKQLLGFAPGGRVGLAKEAFEAFKNKFTPGFYHGSPSNRIKEFDPSKSNKPEEYITPGVTFLTQNPKFAHDYTPIRGTASQMVGQPDQYATGATIYPVSANLGKKFDFDTPEGKALARAFLKEKLIPNQGEKDAARWLSGMQDEHNTWKSLEHPDFLQHLKDTGHNSFAVKEAGINNVGIFDPKNIRGKFAKYNPEDAESADFMKAAGGPVEHYDGGGKVGNMISLLKKLGLSEESIAAWKAANGVNQRQTRNPILQQAAKDLAEGKITSEQYRALARVEMPINSFTSAPNMPSQQDIANALKSNQLETGIIGVNKDIAPGTRVSSRLDIPAYDKYDKWIVSLHDPLDAGKSIGYGQTAHLKGPIDFTASPKAGHAIATGKADKTTYARIHGDWEPTDPEDVYKRAQDLMGDPQWAQVGLNPFRHSYFYDKADMAPVVGGQEALQVGPLVMVKKPQKVDPDDPRFRLSKDKPETFAPGGKVKK